MNKNNKLTQTSFYQINRNLIKINKILTNMLNKTKNNENKISKRWAGAVVYNTLLAKNKINLFLKSKFFKHSKRLTKELNN
jgi:hypothetical protein